MGVTVGRTDHRAERLRQQAERVLADYPGLSGWRRQVLARFLTEVRSGWHTLIHRDVPNVPQNRADALVIGPNGVLAVLLCEAEPSPKDRTATIRFVEELVLGATIRPGSRSGVISTSVVRPYLVLPPNSPVRPTISGFLVATAGQLDPMLTRGERRLDRRDTRALADHVHARTDEYTNRTLSIENSEPDLVGELLAVTQLHQDRFDQALSGPFDRWLTFLDDSQMAMVRRDYAGPARISGPAGTGKSVVALHRLARLGRITVGPLLFTTFARNLPSIAQRQFHRLAPELADRAEFRTLHAWAFQFLRDRDQPLAVSSGETRTCFFLAWSRVGKQSRLSELNPNPHYWHDEVDRVIKGRGLGSEDEYQSLYRRGRGLNLRRGPDRELVWRLYLTYEQIRRERKLYDFNDLITAALTEVQRHPQERAYAAVVVDEVQDIPLIGLRLLHALGGDGPNGLLLVGDGQQQIYPGGWRLSEAGIDIHGRGEVLRTNYRNASRVLDVAKQCDATNEVDDLDGAIGVSLRDSEAILQGGKVQRWRGHPDEQKDALITALRGDLMANPSNTPDDIAVLAFDTVMADRWRTALRDEGIAVSNLDDYDGERNGTVKVGTVFRVKGEEFRAVFLPMLPKRGTASEADREWVERAQRLRLVALTRARDYLWYGTFDDDI